MSRKSSVRFNQHLMDLIIIELSRENGMNYGLMQDIPTSTEILFIQHLMS